jgi:DsbC/DsbD-like thiol-disulfide interchange protein
MLTGVRLGGCRTGSVAFAVVIAIAGVSPAAAQNPPRGAVRVDARIAEAVVRPGDVVTIALTLTHASGFHTWPHEPVVPEVFEGVNPIPTEIELADAPPGAALVEVVWPEPQPVTVHYGGEPTALLSYTGSAPIGVRLHVPPETPDGRATVVLTVRFQACDARLCYRPQNADADVRFRIEK